MSGHTPGPWRWEVGTDGWNGKTCMLVGADGSVVVQGYGYDAWGIDFGQGKHGMSAEEESRLPDACVIAAAPELLGALRAILLACEEDFAGPTTDDLRDSDSVGRSNFGDMKLTFGMIRRARAAIAKAEGRQP